MLFERNKKGERTAIKENGNYWSSVGVDGDEVVIKFGFTPFIGPEVIVGFRHTPKGAENLAEKLIKKARESRDDEDTCEAEESMLNGGERVSKGRQRDGPFNDGARPTFWPPF